MSAKKNNIFMRIREAKVEVAKEILSTFGFPYDKMGEILTADELVKFFDYFDRHTELRDNEELEGAVFTEYGNTCVEKKLLSSESIRRIRREVDLDFIALD